MYTKQMYQEMMSNYHGEWVDFFADVNLEFDEPNYDLTSVVNKLPFLNQLGNRVDSITPELEAA